MEKVSPSRTPRTPCFTRKVTRTVLDWPGWASNSSVEMTVPENMYLELRASCRKAARSAAALVCAETHSTDAWKIRNSRRNFQGSDIASLTEPLEASTRQEEVFI